MVVAMEEYFLLVRHSDGVAFILSKKALGTILDISYINERLMFIHLNARNFNISINLPGYDIKAVNTKVGRSKVWRGTIGRHSLHNMSNDNGERLVHWAAAENLVVADTLFPRKDINKMTWKSPDGRTFNQIDHVPISRRFRSSLCNVRRFRGADADIDHFLVCADMKLKTTKLDSGVRDWQNKQFDNDKLKIPQVRDDFCLDLHNRFQALNFIEVEDNLNINSKWSKVKEAQTKTSGEICGYGRKREEEWFIPRCEETVRRRKEDRLRHLGDPSDEDLKAIFVESQKTAKKIIRQEELHFLNNKIQKVEDDNLNNQARNFYKEVRKVKGSFQPKAIGIKDKDDNVITKKKGGPAKVNRTFL
ncbi:uncharacterized protein LOC143023495 [Oratosquilla oratoria]|uniref:uncharacterized protein LOC143023495 n=1 Tax=Oratosquilla oratoria TaxID=337810 RepID=UPI003F7782AD